MSDMRLIDADKLILHLNDYALQESPSDVESAGDRKVSRAVYKAITDCIRAVDEQPTAFDVDKVVEQLDDEANRSYADFKKYADEIGESESDNWYYIGLRRAIGIVKGGGN